VFIQKASINFLT
jgi:hypothetical protein